MSTTAPEPTGTCAICGTTVHASMLLSHLRGAHGIDVELETWPDGDPVVIDATLTVEDFEAGEPRD